MVNGRTSPRIPVAEVPGLRGNLTRRGIGEINAEAVSLIREIRLDDVDQLGDRCTVTIYICNLEGDGVAPSLLIGVRRGWLGRLLRTIAEIPQVSTDLSVGLRAESDISASHLCIDGGLQRLKSIGGGRRISRRGRNGCRRISPCV